jgi:P-type Ca2+ transporter type 2C
MAAMHSNSAKFKATDPKDESVKQLLDGLSSTEAADRLLKFGPNELPRRQSRNAVRITIEVLKEPMLLLLLIGGLVYLALGDRAEALILLGFALLSVTISVVQEYRTERVLEALRDLTSPRALVIRDGERLRIAGRDVVPGDTLLLGEGDRVPADAVIVSDHDLTVDESLLTGESVPVQKQCGNAENSAEPSMFAFAGSLVVRGSAECLVTATGTKSEIGKIGHSLATLDTEAPRLAAATRRTVLLFAVLGGAISIVAVILSGMTTGDWLNAALAGIALGMSMMPEEFPVVLTVFMAMGAWRISQARVLTRKAAAIESLGAATVLCTDKTGTLTENRMQVAKLVLPDGESWNVQGKMPGAFADIVETGRRASAPEVFDPMDLAFHKLHEKARAESLTGKIVETFGLRRDLLVFAQIWKTSSGKSMIAAKGAPESVAELCALSKKIRLKLKDEVDQMARDGLRVLAIARAKSIGTGPHNDLKAFDFEYIGLAGLADPLRKSARAAVDECRSAGIRVVMITGDYPETARAIAAQAGINTTEVITGTQINDLTEVELAEHAARCHVFARISPTQKLRLVEALKSQGEIVAMTGDGVNDAPSLKAAHIGIAMGGRGTDVAREAASIVLLDDDFGSIVKAVRLGRRIYDNLQKAIGFIFAVHVPIAGMALLPLLFGLPVMFGPVHIAFLEMVIDPVCSLVFEAESDERDVMNRPPRAPNAPLFSIPLVAWSIIQGVFAFGFLAAVYGYTLHQDLPVDEARSLVFFSLIFIIIGLIFVNRSFSTSLRRALFRPNGTIVYVLTIVPAALAALLLVPQAKDLFRFGNLHLDDLILAATAGVALLIVLELLKGAILGLAARYGVAWIKARHPIGLGRNAV